MTALALVTACGPRELILEGERLDIQTGLPVTVVDPGPPPAFAAPQMAINGSWTHARATPAQSIAHPALGRAPVQVWSVGIGEGESRKQRITATPVVAEGRIFAFDSAARLTAVSTNGSVLWSRDLVPAADSAGDASGGGLAVAGGRVYATTGFGRLHALDAATGAEVWVQDLDAVASGAPTVLGNRVYVAGRDGTGWAVDAANGKVLWKITAQEAPAGIVGGPSPAASDRIVVFSFASGEIIGVVPETGTQIWTAYALSTRQGRVHARVGDVTGDPVLAGGRVYVGTHAGETVAIEAGTGQVAWRAAEGALSPVWVAGNSVFLISDLSALVRLDAATGEVLWSTELPYFTRDRARRQAQIFAHFGPILAGGRLLVVSDDGLIRSYDPETGALIGTTELPGGAASDPAIAGGTLYVVNENGQLGAFR